MRLYGETAQHSMRRSGDGYNRTGIKSAAEAALLFLFNVVQNQPAYRVSAKMAMVTR